MSEPWRLGILGGMGPLATLDLQQKILSATPAQSDQDHVPTVVWNVPQIADRQRALAGDGPSPLPQLLNALAGLNRAGVNHIAIPCNTAHHWYDALAAASQAPLLHIADITAQAVAAQAVAAQEARPAAIGLIATRGTLDAGWYQTRFARLGIEVITPSAEELRQWFVPGCYAVKRGALREGGQLLHQLAERLTARGADRLVLACTEVPPALAAASSPHLSSAIDPTDALAQACVQLWRRART
ncbi:amino acid racemase [Brenneria populi subsp. brevivirga]|uniref:aspartate/glutamate racemase family protein n=1 Tax=Brenneria populi TaxID=1505588 RepID=UPI002E190598|nr:amino acid racemase [Brenneria populi subsp. brevivirga]